MQQFIPREFTYESVRNYILNVGAEDIYSGRWQGGYYVQQLPEEFAQAILFLRQYNITDYLEIGAAAGGSARILWDLGIVKNIYLIDDNKHPRSNLRRPILPNAIEWIGDSRSPECEAALRQWGKQFDLVFIDGDHSYQGVVQDVTLVLQFLHAGSLLMLHDTCYHEGPHRLANQMWNKMFPQLKPLAKWRIRVGIDLFLFVPPNDESK